MRSRVATCVGALLTDHATVSTTLHLMEQWLDAENPDVFVFTGDHLNGKTTSWDSKSTVTKRVKPVTDRKIQWATILGNHDSEQMSVSRSELVLLLSRVPYNLTRVGPSHLHGGEGVGKYYIRLESRLQITTMCLTCISLTRGPTRQAARGNRRGPARSTTGFDRTRSTGWFNK